MEYDKRAAGEIGFNMILTVYKSCRIVNRIVSHPDPRRHAPRRAKAWCLLIHAPPPAPPTSRCHPTPTHPHLLRTLPLPLPRPVPHLPVAHGFALVALTISIVAVMFRQHINLVILAKPALARLHQKVFGQICLWSGAPWGGGGTCSALGSGGGSGLGAGAVKNIFLGAHVAACCALSGGIDCLKASVLLSLSSFCFAAAEYQGRTF